jgi:site-specific DNA recombinase
VARASAAKPTRVDGYVRVSRRAGREGESFISPEVQRRKIADWAKLHEVEVIRWWEEIDQSGAKLERPQFQQALARCEAGETGGIVVARLDRFARSAVDALESIKRLNEAGARLVSVEDNFDGSMPMGRFAIGILTLIAELELERIKESWDTAVREAIGRGVYISARVPAGYRKDESGRLVPVEPDVSMIAEAFRKRATGSSWTRLARFLEENGVYPSTGNEHWSTPGVASMIRNRAYLGEARQGEIVNKKAHEPIVTQAEFDAAQSGRTLLKPQHDGSIASQAVLGGLVRCAGCGHTLKITGNGKPGERYPIYYCSGRYAKGLCPARATIRASHLDTYVEAQILAVLKQEHGLLAQAVEASEALEQARRAVEEAEHELDLFLSSPKLLSILGEAKVIEGVEARQLVLDEARRQLAELSTQSNLIDELTSGDLLAAWPDLTIQEKRKLLHGLLDRVVLRRATGRGKHAPPIAERTQIVLRGNVLLGENPDDASSLPERG